MTEQVLDERELVKRLRHFVRVNPKRSAGAVRQWLNADLRRGDLVFDPLAAHLVVLLDERAFSALLEALSPDDAARLTTAIKSLSGEVGEVRSLLRAFYKLCQDQQPFSLSPEQLAPKPTPSVPIQKTSFPRLRALPVKSLAHVLQQEHPQAIALVVAHLGGEIGAQVLSAFGADEQVEICRRISVLEPVPPPMLTEIEETLLAQLGEVEILDEHERIAQLAALCTQLPDLGELELFPQLNEADADLAQEIREHMYTFDDLIHIDDRGMQKLIAAVPRRDLVLALKRASAGVRDKVLDNISQRARQALLEDVELVGRVRLSEVKAAQSAVIEVARRLETEGEIINTGPLSKEVYV